MLPQTIVFFNKNISSITEAEKEAAGVGFEPTVRINEQLFSKQPC